MNASAARRRRLLAGSTLALVALVLAIDGVGGFDRAEEALVDARFELRGDREADPRLALVLIDDGSLQQIGTFPFPRDVHATVLTRLRKAGARVIAYDVVFAEPGPDQKADERLVRAVRDAGNVVLAASSSNAPGVPNVLGGGDAAQRFRFTAGSTSLALDDGGVARVVPLSSDGLPSLAAAVAQRYSAEVELDVPDRRRLIDFAGGEGVYPAIPFAAVAAGEFRPELVRDRIVIVGASDATLQDVHPTPTTSAMPGPEILANSVATVLDGFPLGRVSELLRALLVVALGALPGMLALALRPAVAMGAALLGGVAYLALAQLAFGAGVILPVAAPLAVLGACLVATLFVSYLLATFERQRLRDTFGRFVPGPVIDDVLARTEGNWLGGELIEGTVMFCDLRGFTTYSESRPAAQIIDVLNRYLGMLTRSAMGNGGTLTTYLGDGLMALWGGPLAQIDHADLALESAVNMLELMQDVNESVRRDGLGEGFLLGIGLNTGPVLAGNVGTEERLEYTAIGDTVNTASRVEGLTKDLGHQILMAEGTRVALTRPHADLIDLGEVAIRGRAAKLHVWAVG